MDAKKSRLVSKEWNQFTYRYDEIQREKWTNRYKNLEKFKAQKKLFFLYHLHKSEIPDLKNLVRPMEIHCYITHV